MCTKFDSVNILGVRVDKITMEEAVDQVISWVKEGKGKHYIVTPNVEFIMAARKDPQFKKVLDDADLAIADSARLGWAEKELVEKNFLKKLIIWPFFLLPNLVKNPHFSTVTGTDLMEGLCQRAAEKGFTIGLLGGRDKVAERAGECLKKKHQNLKVVLTEGGPEVNLTGESEKTDPLIYRPTDILFVAFGQVKQEKWIAQNLSKIPVKVAMGVGGAFDYLSGSVPRAPFWMRSLGMEWLFRLMIQPWRIKRFGALVKFVWLVLVNQSGENVVN